MADRSAIMPANSLIFFAAAPLSSMLSGVIVLAASHRLVPAAWAAAAIRPTVTSPIPREGVLTMRRNASSSFGLTTSRT